MQRVDLTNRKFNMLLCIEPTNDRSGTSVIWKCMCDCGSVCYKGADTIQDGRTKSCGCLLRKSKNQYGTGFLTLYNSYKRNAAKRNIDFNLSENEFNYLIIKDCTYCGRRALQTSRKLKGLYYNGIDRIDNNDGYNLNNCTTCCKICNRAKDTMSIQDFKFWINKVYKNIIERN